LVRADIGPVEAIGPRILRVGVLSSTEALPADAVFTDSDLSLLALVAETARALSAGPEPGAAAPAALTLTGLPPPALLASSFISARLLLREAMVVDAPTGSRRERFRVGAETAAVTPSSDFIAFACVVASGICATRCATDVAAWFFRSSDVSAFTVTSFGRCSSSLVGGGVATTGSGVGMTGFTLSSFAT
jgi:hypothetical protein